MHRADRVCITDRSALILLPPKRHNTSSAGMCAISARDVRHPCPGWRTYRPDTEPIPEWHEKPCRTHDKKQRERLRFPVKPLPPPIHLSAKYQSVVKQHVARDFGEFRRVRLSQTYGSLRPVRRPAANDMSEKYRFHFVQSGSKRH